MSANFDEKELDFCAFSYLADEAKKYLKANDWESKNSVEGSKVDIEFGPSYTRLKVDLIYDLSYFTKQQIDTHSFVMLFVKDHRSLPPKEVSFYVRDKQLHFEFNGLIDALEKLKSFIRQTHNFANKNLHIENGPLAYCVYNSLSFARLGEIVDTLKAIDPDIKVTYEDGLYLSFSMASEGRGRILLSAAKKDVYFNFDKGRTGILSDLEAFAAECLLYFFY